jgi:hypothetical protein
MSETLTARRGAGTAGTPSTASGTKHKSGVTIAAKARRAGRRVLRGAAVVTIAAVGGLLARHLSGKHARTQRRC